MVSLQLMQPNVLRTRQASGLWLRALHGLYAGLFAFVLPLICWGAQATPGHPHARAHFVFVAPPLQANAAPATTNAGSLASAGVDHTAHHAAQEAAEKPVGRSGPSMLGCSLLLLIGLSGALLPRKGNEPTFSNWVIPPVAESVTPSIPTPPPR